MKEKEYEKSAPRRQKIDVAAYIWPAYTGKEPRTYPFWPDGIGEWQTVKLAEPKCDRHIWPRKPLMGYEDEADPAVMERQIALAVSHGVNVFAYDWYWFDERPFLEQCLNDGFLGAKNNGDMRFYLMWANHDAGMLWDRRLSERGEAQATIWQGRVHPQVFEEIGRRWIERYFTRENYYKIDGKPLIAIYEIANFLAGFGGDLAAAGAAMRALDEEAKRRGLPGVHFQLIHQKSLTNLTGVDGAKTGIGCDELLTMLPFSSVTHYQYVHFADVGRDYPTVMKDVVREWERLAALSPVPYYPHVSLGWDNNPRFKTRLMGAIMTENTPENLEAAFRLARDFALEHGAPLVTVNAWNEWTEGSYLLPDDLSGDGYLRASRKVFLEEETEK